MFFLFLCWLMLTVVATGVGLLIIGQKALAPPAPSKEHAQDALLLAAWLGIAAITLSAFAAILFVSLDVTASIVILASAALLAARGWLRVSHLEGFRHAWRSLLPALTLIALVLAERSTQVGNLDDAGGYHWGLIQWYGEAGIPFGLGLFQWRLTTHSSWFAFTALFNHGVLASRVGNLANGLLLLWVLLHVFAVLKRVLSGIASKGDIFFLVAMTLILHRMLGWEMRLSPSHDIPAILLCAVIGWAWLQFRDTSTTSSVGLPLIGLAAFAVTVKLTGIPLLFAMLLISGWATRNEPRQWWSMAAVAAAPIAVLIAASFISSGCVLFPSPVLCFQTPWGVGAAAAREYSAMAYVGADRNIAAFVVASAAALIAMLPRLLKSSADPERGVAVIACAGIAFIYYFSPQLRYGLGYFVLLPALALASYAAPLSRWLERLPHAAGSASRASLVVLVLIAFALPLYKEFIHEKLRTRRFDSLAERKRGDARVNGINSIWYLIPNKVAYSGRIVSAPGNGFVYEVSPDANCWDRGPLCASNPDLSSIDGIRLRDAARGIRGGFVRLDASPHRGPRQPSIIDPRS